MTAPAGFRAFYAVPFAPATTGALEAAARERLADPGFPEPGFLGEGWRATPAGRIHLTLRFLGDAPREALPGLEEALRAAAASADPFSVELGGWLLLPGPRDPRVLAVRVSDPAGRLSRLAALLEERAVALGFPAEARPFLAHVTVARRRPGGRRPGSGRGRDVGRNGGVPPAASGGSAVPIATDTVDRVVLMSSTLGPSGPSYAVVAEAELRGRPGTG